jgi:hypothetical protein
MALQKRWRAHRAVSLCSACQLGFLSRWVCRGRWNPLSPPHPLSHSHLHPLTLSQLIRSKRDVEERSGLVGHELAEAVQIIRSTKLAAEREEAGARARASDRHRLGGGGNRAR